MARAWGRQLVGAGWQRILASDLGRVRETVALVNDALGLPIAYDSRLREQDWGAWSGLTLPELRRDQGERLAAEEARGWEFRPPGGEARTEVLARCRAALDAAHYSWPGQRILVICHEGVIKVLLYSLLGRKFLPGEEKILRGYALHHLSIGHSGLALEGLNALALASGE